MLWALSGVLPAEMAFAQCLKGDFNKARICHFLFNPMPMILQDVFMPNIMGPKEWFEIRDLVVCIECWIFSVVFGWAFSDVRARFAVHRQACSIYISQE